MLKPIFDLALGIVPSVLIFTFSNLQVTRTGIKSQTGSNFGCIVQFVVECLPLCAKKPIFDLFRGIGPLVLIATSFNLQLFRTGIKYWIGQVQISTILYNLS